MNVQQDQKIVIVCKETADKGHPYSIINLEAIDHAATLKPNSFRLWIYIAKNQNGYKFALSQVAFCNWSGVSRSTYLSSVKDLVEQGYLVECEDTSGNKNVYNFYELPNKNTFPKTKDDLMLNIPKEKIEDKNNFKF
jgi:hypothetical protein